MQEFEKRQFEEWQATHAFEKIVHYVDLLKDPSYEHLGQKAAALNNLRRYQEAQALLEAIYSDGKDDTMWHYRYAYLHMQFERFDQAVESLKTAISLDETNGNAWYLLSVLYEFYLNEPDLAKMAHQKAIQNGVSVEYLKDDTYRLHQKFNEAYQFVCCSMIKQHTLSDQIKETLKQLIDIFETHVQRYEQLPEIMQAFTHTIKRLFSDYEYLLTDSIREAIEEDVLYVLDWFGISVPLADALCAMYRFESYQRDDFNVQAKHLMYWFETSDKPFNERVLEIFNQLSDEEKTIDYYLLACEVYLEMENTKKVKSLLNEVAQLGQTHDVWWQLNGYLALLEEKYDTAIIALEKAATLNQNNVEAWLGLEQLYLDYFEDIPKANYAREQWERIMDN